MYYQSHVVMVGGNSSRYPPGVIYPGRSLLSFHRLAVRTASPSLFLYYMSGEVPEPPYCCSSTLSPTRRKVAAQSRSVRAEFLRLVISSESLPPCGVSASRRCSTRRFRPPLPLGPSSPSSGSETTPPTLVSRSKVTDGVVFSLKE